MIKVKHSSFTSTPLVGVVYVCVHVSKSTKSWIQFMWYYQSYCKFVNPKLLNQLSFIKDFTYCVMANVFMCTIFGQYIYSSLGRQEILPLPSLPGKKVVTQKVLDSAPKTWSILIGCKHGQVYPKMLRYTKTIILLVKHLKAIAMCWLNRIFFSWQSLPLYSILKQKISIWYLQKSSFKMMLKSKWLNLDLDINFMTLSILSWNFFFFIFLEYVMNLRAPLPQKGNCRKTSIWCHFIIFQTKFRQVLL